MNLRNRYKRINGKFVINTSPIIKQSKKTARMFSEEKVYIYGLFSPILNKYFYIGQTQYPEKRKRQHKLNQDDNTNKKYHIKLLKSKGLIFRMDILAEITKELANKWEQAYIKHLRRIGHPLTNREGYIEIESKDSTSDEYIDTLLLLDEDEPVSEKTKQDISFLLSL